MSISKGTDKTAHHVRFTESTSGAVYAIAMGAMDPKKDGYETTSRVEIWRQKDGTYDLELVGCKTFSGVGAPRNSLVIGNNRSGSIIDDTVTVIYPEGWGGPYRVFFVTLN